MTTALIVVQFIVLGFLRWFWILIIVLGFLGLLRSFWTGINRARQSNAAMSPEERIAAQTAMYAKVEEARRNLAAVSERLEADRKGINRSDGHEAPARRPNSSASICTFCGSLQSWYVQVQ